MEENINDCKREEKTNNKQQKQQQTGKKIHLSKSWIEPIVLKILTEISFYEFRLINVLFMKLSIVEVRPQNFKKLYHWLNYSTNIDLFLKLLHLTPLTTFMNAG